MFVCPTSGHSEDHLQIWLDYVHIDVETVDGHFFLQNFLRDLCLIESGRHHRYFVADAAGSYGNCDGYPAYYDMY